MNYQQLMMGKDSAQIFEAAFEVMSAKLGSRPGEEDITFMDAFVNELVMSINEGHNQSIGKEMLKHMSDSTEFVDVTHNELSIATKAGLTL